MTRFDYYALIQGWAADRNFRKGATVFGQALKLAEEYGEFISNFNRKRDTRDDIGDVLVVVTVIRHMLGMHAPTRLRTQVPGFTLNHMLCNAQRCISSIMRQGNIALDHTPNMGILEMELDGLEEAMIGLASFLDLAPEDCLAQAWNDIKDRKGKMIDGKFVKEADLRASNVQETLAQDCSSLCAAGEPCMVTDSGACNASSPSAEG